jgi:hypothetical protein
MPHAALLFWYRYQPVAPIPIATNPARATVAVADVPLSAGDDGVSAGV